MDLNEFKHDPQKALDGVWIDVDSVTSIRVARFGNKHFQDALRELVAPYKAALQKNAIAQELKDKVTIEAMAKCLLVDWRGMSKNGEPLPYSVEAAIEVLSDPTLADFREFVLQVSQDLENYRATEAEEMLGKSKSSSDGQSNGAASASS